MDLEKIEKIAELMTKHNLAELELKSGDDSISLKYATAAPVAVASVAAPAAAAAAPAAAANDNLPTIDAQLVGTFYSAASPEAGAYVKVGDKVEADSTVCIIEAMKVMNEIKAETSGVIAEILVDNASPVEFGQPLFKIKPE